MTEWFVLNARDARWRENELGAFCTFEGDVRFDEVGINLNALQRMRVVERARSGGRRGTSGRAASLRARLLELHLSGEAIEAGIAGSDEPIFGPVALVGSDHIAVGEEAAPEWFVPLASLAYVAFVRTTDPSPDLGA